LFIDPFSFPISKWLFFSSAHLELEQELNFSIIDRFFPAALWHRISEEPDQPL
jgi:hypothetical protein